MDTLLHASRTAQTYSVVMLRCQSLRFVSPQHHHLRFA